MSLTGPQKTLINTVETDLTAAINSLTSPTDSAQFGVRAVLMLLRQDLEIIRVERTQ